jgi:hypothetical protein
LRKKKEKEERRGYHNSYIHEIDFKAICQCGNFKAATVLDGLNSNFISLPNIHKIAMHDKLDRLSLKQPSFITQAVTLVCLWFSFKATRYVASARQKT